MGADPTPASPDLVLGTPDLLPSAPDNNHGREGHVLTGGAPSSPSLRGGGGGGCCGARLGRRQGEDTGGGVGDRLLGERRGGALSNLGGPPSANIVHLGKETEEKKGE
jgi:hypothetical protein